jgi:hypothetical protein
MSSAALFAETASTPLTPQERAYAEMYANVLWVDEQDPEQRKKTLYGAVTRLPEGVKEQLLEAARSGVFWTNLEGLSTTQANRIRERMVDLLMDEERGVAIEDIVQEILSIAPTTYTEGKAARVARTELQAFVTKGREYMYEREPEYGDELFVWQGPQDHRTTDACEWLKQRTHPAFGGDPVPLDELKELVRRAQEMFFPSLEYREWTVHPFERHTVMRWS